MHSLHQHAPSMAAFTPILHANTTNELKQTKTRYDHRGVFSRACGVMQCWHSGITVNVRTAELDSQNILDCQDHLHDYS